MEAIFLLAGAVVCIGAIFGASKIINRAVDAEQYALKRMVLARNRRLAAEVQEKRAKRWRTQAAKKNMPV